jgi:hypothetical protein
VVMALRHLVETPAGQVEASVRLVVFHLVHASAGRTCGACLALVVDGEIVHAAACHAVRPAPRPRRAPAVGDRVDVAPHRKDVYGVRVGRVEMLVAGGAWISVPGYDEPWLVPLEHLVVVELQQPVAVP